MWGRTRSPGYEAPSRRDKVVKKEALMEQSSEASWAYGGLEGVG